MEKSEKALQKFRFHALMDALLAEHESEVASLRNDVSSLRALLASLQRSDTEIGSDTSAPRRILCESFGHWTALPDDIPDEPAASLPMTNPQAKGFTSVEVEELPAPPPPSDRFPSGYASDRFPSGYAKAFSSEKSTAAAGLFGQRGGSHHQLKLLHRHADKKTLAQQNRDDMVGETNDTDDTVRSLLDSEVLFAVLIIANAVFLGWQADQEAQGVSMSEWTVLLAKSIFCILFCIELIGRVMKENVSLWKFVSGTCWFFNVLDIIVILASLLEIIMHLAFEESKAVARGSLMRVLRLLRLTRALQLTRAMPQLRDLRVFTSCIAKGFWAWIWIVVAIASIVYGIAVYLTSLAAPICTDVALRDDEFLCLSFSSVGSSCLTLTSAMFGGLLWGDIVRSLASIGAWSQVTFQLFMVFWVVLVLNVALGIILGITNDALKSEKQIAIDDAIRKKQEHIETMRDIFWEMDKNKSGEISFDEFELACSDIRMDALLSSLDLHVYDIGRLFELLDADGNGAIGIEDFIAGCQRLQGEAKSIDLLPMQAQIGRILSHVKALRKFSHLQASESHVASLVKFGREDALAGDGGDVSEEESSVAATIDLALAKSMRKATPECIIPQTEMRAMTLTELEGIRSVVEMMCSAGICADPQSGIAIRKAHAVDLYTLAYNYITPFTVLDHVVLQGLAVGDYKSGQLVKQDSSHTLGVVKVDSAGPDVEVELLRGLFRSPNLDGALDADDIPGCINFDGIASQPFGGMLVRQPVSYKELVGRGPTKPAWYCSHWWGEPVLDFIRCCEEHSEHRSLSGSSSTYWVCAYAMRQSALQDELTDSPTDSPFYKAMGLADGVLLILDKCAVVFSRIWCDFELYASFSNNKMLDVVTVQHTSVQPNLLTSHRLPWESPHDQAKRENLFPVGLFGSGLRVMLEYGQASVEADKQKILQHLLRDGGDGLKKANACLHSYFAKAVWPQALRRGFVENFDQDSSAELSLPDLLRADTWRTSLDLSFAHMEEADTQAMNALARGLPETLIELKVALEGCSNICDESVAELARGFPTDLQVLTLDLLGCRKVTDACLEHLASSLPAGMIELTIHLDNCSFISVEGLRMLAENAPTTITRFHGTFRGTQADCSISSIAGLKKYGRK